MRNDGSIPDELISGNIENTINSSLAEIRKKIKNYDGLTKCVNPDCDEPPVKGFRFCCMECRDHYEVLIKTGVVRE